MLPELIGLIDIAVKMVGRKSELDKEYFDQFVQPLWENFVKIHVEYKESFQKYIDFINSDDFQLESLKDMIRKDSIRTSDWRSELEKSIAHLPSSHLLNENKENLSDFVKAIHRYFIVRLTSETVEGKTIANLRYSAYIYLSRQGDSDIEKDKAIVKFNNISRHIRQNYDAVADAYYKLKGKLLA